MHNANHVAINLLISGKHVVLFPSQSRCQGLSDLTFSTVSQEGDKQVAENSTCSEEQVGLLYFVLILFVSVQRTKLKKRRIA